MEGRQLELWLGQTNDADEAVQLLSSFRVPFLTTRVTSLSSPVLFFGSRRFDGLHEIRGFLQNFAGNAP